jgi:hypothetical protein
MITIHAAITPSPEQWEFVIREMRNSWESWEKSDSLYAPGAFVLGPADADLCRRLVKAGADHAKFMRQLPIHIALTAPDYFWREFDTYRIGVSADDITQNSTSMMHVLGRSPFTASMFDFGDVLPDDVAAILTRLNAARDRWVADNKRKGPDATAWRAMLQQIPDSWRYRRGVSLNYAAARAMFHARQFHRLREWRRLCGEFATLPWADVLIVGDV